MKRSFVMVVLASAIALAANAQSPQIYGSNGRYLGNLNANRYDPNSVSNPYGIYGSRYSPYSINNPYGMYGSPYSPYSARNPYAVQAPIISAPMMPSSTGWNMVPPPGPEIQPFFIQPPTYGYGTLRMPSLW